MESQADTNPLQALDPVAESDIATRLDVPRKRVNLWRHRGLLPEADATAGGRPLWRWRVIADWWATTPIRSRK